MKICTVMTSREIRFYQTVCALQQQDNTMWPSLSEEQSKAMFTDMLQQHVGGEKYRREYMQNWLGSYDEEGSKIDQHTFTSEQLKMMYELSTSTGLSLGTIEDAIAQTMQAYNVRSDEQVDSIKQIAQALDAMGIDDTSYLKAVHTELRERQLQEKLVALNHIVDGVTKGYLDHDEGLKRMQELRREIQR